jgi:hypothetical protein
MNTNRTERLCTLVREGASALLEVRIEILPLVCLFHIEEVQALPPRQGLSHLYALGMDRVENIVSVTPLLWLADSLPREQCIVVPVA